MTDREPLPSDSAARSADSANTFCKPAWRSLTSGERKILWRAARGPMEFGELIEAKLKEKNAC